MNIRMYNVNFGDCFLLNDNTQNLLVDFGSDTPHILSNIAENIVRSCHEKKLSVLMTHFHKDHINGFWETSLSEEINIENIYIPDIFAMGSRSTLGKLTFLQLHILSDIFDSVILQKGSVKITLYSLLKSLTNVRTNIYLLKRGDTFSFASQNYQVLWPNFNNLSLHKKVEKAIIALLAKIGFIEADLKDISPFMEYTPIDLGPIDHFIETLLDGYRALLQEELDNPQIMDSINRTFTVMSSDVEQRCSYLSKELIDDLRAAVKSMRQQENKISIVFQDQAISKVSSLLMTGDITVPELKKVISNQGIGFSNFKMSAKYQIIKSPHHATNSHFTNLLPRCDKILASNGAPDPSHRNWGKISYQYGSFYGSHKGCEIICSNRRCELYELPHVTNCANCSLSPVSWLDVSL